MASGIAEFAAAAVSVVVAACIFDAESIPVDSEAVAAVANSNSIATANIAVVPENLGVAAQVPRTFAVVYFGQLSDLAHS